MAPPRVSLATALASTAVVLATAALAVPVLEVRPLEAAGGGVEIALVHAPALWDGMLVWGTGLPTFAAAIVACTAVARMGRRGSRVLLLAAAGLVQLETGLLRIAAWDVLGSGLGVARTRFGLLLLGACAGLFLLAAATVGTAAADRPGWAARSPPSAWTRFRTNLKKARHPRWF